MNSLKGTDLERIDKSMRESLAVLIQEAEGCLLGLVFTAHDYTQSSNFWQFVTSRNMYQRFEKAKTALNDVMQKLSFCVDTSVLQRVLASEGITLKIEEKVGEIGRQLSDLSSIKEEKD